MKQGSKSPYSEYCNHKVFAKVTDTQHQYLKARAMLDNKDIQDVVRQLIDKAYENEKRNNIDIIKTAKENGLI